MVRQLNDLDPVNEVKGYSKLRDILRRTDRATGKSNLQRLYQDLHESGYVEGLMDDGQLTTGNKPFNVFAKVSMGLMPQKASEKAAWKGTEEENKKLGQYEKKFMVACNREENDINWESDDEDWVGKVISDAPREPTATPCVLQIHPPTDPANPACPCPYRRAAPRMDPSQASMGIRHRFLLVRDLSWWTYNIAVVGMRPDPETGEKQPHELVRPPPHADRAITATTRKPHFYPLSSPHSAFKPAAPARPAPPHSTGQALPFALNSSQQLTQLPRVQHKAKVMVEEMIEAAKLYTKETDGWSDTVGMYFHAFPKASVNALHMVGRSLEPRPCTHLHASPGPSHHRCPHLRSRTQ